jgi:cell shape-determining protein MreC
LLMKMMYPIRNTKRSLFSPNLIKILVMFLAVVLLVLVFNTSNPVRSLTGDLLSPVFKTGNFFYKNFGQIPKYFSDKNKLAGENEKLLDELEKTLVTEADYESIKYENDKLREELKLKPVGNFIAASVIAKSPQIPLDSLFLDRGTADGINNGDFILVAERILIGKIVKISGNKATVALNSFAGNISYGYVARTNEPLEMKGNGGGGIEAKVPIDFDITVGDKIMVGGPFESFAAVVGAVEEDRSSGFKKILMSLPADISKINIVFIYPLNA